MLRGARRRAPDATPLACATATTSTRYRIDAVTLPGDIDEANADGLDLYGFDSENNALGVIVGVLASDTGIDPSAATAAALAAGVDWEIAIETCPSSGESRVRVGTAGGTTSRAGGDLVGSGLQATHGCGEAPVGTLIGGPDAAWVLADQMALDVDFGAGELSGVLDLALDQPAALRGIAPPYAAALTANGSASLEPGDTVDQQFDANGDGVITAAELESNPLWQNLTVPDATGSDRPPGEPTCPADGSAWISFGFAIHATELP